MMFTNREHKEVWIWYNNNPRKGQLVGDCVIRAVSIVTGQDWDSSYIDICRQGFEMCDMPSSNAVWGEYLRKNGFTKHIIPDTCPQCYTVQDFCADNPHGVFVLATGSHVVAVLDGDYLDAWDSGSEVPVYLWKKER